MLLQRSDLVTAAVLSVLLHALVIGLVSFSWTSDPELQRRPIPPSFVQAVVMEKQPQAPAKPKPKPKPEAAPKPKPKPESVPVSKPAEVKKPAPTETKKPAETAPSFSEPDLSELLAREELDMVREDQVTDPGEANEDDTARQSENDAQVTSYQQAIQQAITNRWIIPATARRKDDLVARVRVHVLPGGEVLDVALVASSGDSAFDESVRSAIRSVGTLPVPSGELFHEHFRVMTFEFNPRMKSQ